MKSKFLIAAIGLFTVSLLSSCRQDRNCGCVVDGQESVITYNQESMKYAKEACEKREAAAKIVDPKATCEIKE